MKKLLIGSLCLILPLLGYGDTIYKTTDPQGNVLFTDKPVKGAEEINTAPVQGYTAPAVPTTPPPAATGEPTAPVAKVPYDRFEIVEPTVDEAGGKVASVWSAPGTLTVSVAVNPSLQQGDTLEILLDGVATDSQDATSFTFNDLNPGEHTVSAQIVDANKQVMISAPALTVYIHRAAYNPQPVAVPSMGGGGGGMR